MSSTVRDNESDDIDAGRWGCVDIGLDYRCRLGWGWDRREGWGGKEKHGSILVGVMAHGISKGGVCSLLNKCLETVIFCVLLVQM